MLEEIRGRDLPDLEIPITTAQIETLPMKMALLQRGGHRKKMKVHKGVL
jgi:hypothetical protein